MLSRRLTVTISLLLVSLAGCENQGKGAGTDAIDVICGYEYEAIEQLGCLTKTAQCAEGTQQKDYFRNKCESNQRVVAPRCRDQQRALADCFTKLIEVYGDRKAAFSEIFECTLAASDWYAPTAEVIDDPYNVGGRLCPASVNVDTGTPELCAKVAAQKASGTADPTLEKCTVMSGIVAGETVGDIGNRVGVWNGDAKVKDDGADPPVPSFCVTEIAALTACSEKVPTNIP
jgi:hypothetical protein